MRRVTRNLILAILGAAAFLLALGALPGLLASGEPYVVTATPVNGSDGVGSGETGGLEPVDSGNLSERVYPYTTGALADASATEAGRSDPYRKGPTGFKEAFTHSPFDEIDALRQQYPNATVGDGVVVSRNGTLYRVAVTR